MTPEGWSSRRIGAFAQRVKRQNTEGLDLEPLSVTKYNGVVRQSEKYKKRIATDPVKYVIAQDGDFAFDPMSLYYGAIGLVRGVGRGLISPDYVSFATDASVHDDFLDKLLRFPEMHKVYESLSETGNSFGKRRRLYWSVFENIELSLPPLPEQRKIAAILSSVDDAIEATQAVNRPAPGREEGADGRAADARAAGAAHAVQADGGGGGAGGVGGGATGGGRIVRD